jgi:GTP-binding protein
LFIDYVKIKVKAGDGGGGAVSFHREKYVSAGGPDGGDGGKGGDVVFVVNPGASSLIDYRYKTKFEAENGQPGGNRKCTGRSGKDLVLRVPAGTVVRDVATGRVLADLSGDEPVVIAKGGRGGWGNARFATPTRQIPRFAKPGLPGEAFELSLELKLIADVGLVGFPNVGKSTLISAVSGARPKVANYPFTTLTPVLGVVKIDEASSFVMADIPGLIEGASEGVGLGHAFLRHVERCRLILHVVDASGIEGRDPKEDFDKINLELARFSPELARQPQIVAANKCDIASPEQIEALREFVEAQGYTFFPISAAAHQGLEPLINHISTRLAHLPPVRVYEPEPLPVEDVQERDRFDIRVEQGVYYIDAPFLVRILEMANMDDYESLQYFQRVLQKSGVIDALEELGIQEGATVDIDGFAFEYMR